MLRLKPVFSGFKNICYAFINLSVWKATLQNVGDYKLCLGLRCTWSGDPRRSSFKKSRTPGCSPPGFRAALWWCSSPFSILHWWVCHSPLSSWILEMWSTVVGLEISALSVPCQSLWKCSSLGSSSGLHCGRASLCRFSSGGPKKSVHQSSKNRALNTKKWVTVLVQKGSLRRKREAGGSQHMQRQGRLLGKARCGAVHELLSLWVLFYSCATGNPVRWKRDISPWTVSWTSWGRGLEAKWRGEGPEYKGEGGSGGEPQGAQSCPVVLGQSGPAVTCVS